MSRIRGIFCAEIFVGKKIFGYSLFKQQDTMLVEETLISDVVWRYSGLQIMNFESYNSRPYCSLRNETKRNKARFQTQFYRNDNYRLLISEPLSFFFIATHLILIIFVSFRFVSQTTVSPIQDPTFRLSCVVSSSTEPLYPVLSCLHFKPVRLKLIVLLVAAWTGILQPTKACLIFIVRVCLYVLSKGRSLIWMKGV